MKIKGESVCASPKSETLKKIESFHRVMLPSSFSDFINSNNGTVPESLTFTCNGQERLVERFLCILDDPKSDPIKGQYDISVVIAQIEDRLTDNEDLVGAEIIPFAVVFGGDFLCLDYRKEPENPSVILWDHNESDELEPVTYLVSSSFDKFLDQYGQ